MKLQYQQMKDPIPARDLSHSGDVYSSGEIKSVTLCKLQDNAEFKTLEQHYKERNKVARRFRRPFKWSIK